MLWNGKTKDLAMTLAIQNLQERFLLPQAAVCAGACVCLEGPPAMQGTCCGGTTPCLWPLQLLRIAPGNAQEGEQVVLSPSVIPLCLSKGWLSEQLLNTTLSSMMVATSGRPWTTLARPGDEQIGPFSFPYQAAAWLCFAEGRKLIYLRFSAIAASLKVRERKS